VRIPSLSLGGSAASLPSRTSPVNPEVLAVQIEVSARHPLLAPPLLPVDASQKSRRPRRRPADEVLDKLFLKTCRQPVALAGETRVGVARIDAAADVKGA
jgi:hypothetical protein